MILCLVLYGLIQGLVVMYYVWSCKAAKYNLDAEIVKKVGLNEIEANKASQQNCSFLGNN